MSQASDTEIKRWALDASDWLWGTVQGAWNDKQTASQIVVDAVIGMIPLVGDVTAARDLIAVGTGLASDDKKREEVMEWVLLVVLLFALIPVVGGAIKGVGRLLIKSAKAAAGAAKDAEALAEIVQFLNRLGHGNAVKWIKDLDVLSYQAQLLEKFHGFMDTLVNALSAMRDKIGWLAPASMKAAIDLWIERFKALKELGGKMIPKALKELNERLKAVQQAVYKGEWHSATAGTKTTVRETEARLIEGGPHPKPKVRHGYPQNKIADYEHVEGWPDLGKKTVMDEHTRKELNETIAAFSGKIAPKELKPGDVIYRVLKPQTATTKGNYKASPWWLTEMPKSAEEWREGLAVLDKFNKNTYYIKYVVPEGITLKGWMGKASEQFDGAVGQYLGGGKEQLFIEFPGAVKAELEKLPELKTGWGETLKLFGFGDNANAAITEIRIEQLAANEKQSKVASKK
jgi:hypothetical protein